MCCSSQKPQTCLLVPGNGWNSFDHLNLPCKSFCPKTWILNPSSINVLSWPSPQVPVAVRAPPETVISFVSWIAKTLAPKQRTKKRIITTNVSNKTLVRKLWLFWRFLCFCTWAINSATSTSPSPSTSNSLVASFGKLRSFKFTFGATLFRIDDFFAAVASTGSTGSTGWTGSGACEPGDARKDWPPLDKWVYISCSTRFWNRHDRNQLISYQII